MNHGVTLLEDDLASQFGIISSSIILVVLFICATAYLHPDPRGNISITAGIICCCNSPAIPNTRILARLCVAQIAAFFFVSLDCLELVYVYSLPGQGRCLESESGQGQSTGNE